MFQENRRGGGLTESNLDQIFLSSILDIYRSRESRILGKGDFYIIIVFKNITLEFKRGKDSQTFKMQNY